MMVAAHPKTNADKMKVIATQMAIAKRDGGAVQTIAHGAIGMIVAFVRTAPTIFLLLIRMGMIATRTLQKLSAGAVIMIQKIFMQWACAVFAVAVHLTSTCTRNVRARLKTLLVKMVDWLQEGPATVLAIAPAPISTVQLATSQTHVPKSDIVGIGLLEK